MGKDTDKLREEIDQIRGRMGETVEAIAYKADVPSRIGDAITGTIGNLDGVQRSAKDAAKDAIENTKGVIDTAKGAVAAVRENPLGLFFGAAAVGFLIGSLLPGTRLERERLGPIGDQLKEQAKERVQDSIGAARTIAVDVVTGAMSGAGARPTNFIP